MWIVLVKVDVCVLERKNLMASPFTSPLKTLLGWEEENWRYWKVLVGLKYVLRSRRLVWENLSPLRIFRSRNCTCMSEMLHVNLMLGCILFSKCKGCCRCSVSRLETGWALGQGRLSQACP